MTYNYMSDEKDNKITTETTISSSDKDFVKKLRSFSKSCQSMHVGNFNNTKQIISKDEIERFKNNADSIKKSTSLNKNLLENFSNINKSFDTLNPEFGKPIEFTRLDATMFIDHKLVALRKISEKLPDTEKMKEAVLENEENKQLLWLEYNSCREIILNGVFCIHKCQSGQINDRLLKFLLENPNQVFTRNELFENGTLKETIGENEDVRSNAKETKSFYQLLEDIKISGDLKKLFFGKDLSENTICLTNPITKANMNEARVRYINIALKEDNKRPKKNK
jgi:hypothetical protein